MLAAQLRRKESEITRRGARLVAIGTGDARYAHAFIESEKIDFLVLLDEDGAAADAASLKHGNLMQLTGPKSVAHGAVAFFKGHRQHKLGRRPTQLGATFVIGPGNHVRLEHIDQDVTDHARLEEMYDALEHGDESDR